MQIEGGFNIVWAAEHHSLEMTIAPNPFQILTWFAGRTNDIRLGTAVAVAAYWNPINLAGEAALLDQISGGRLEFGIGSGAYQREFDRMCPGLKQSDAWRYMQEMLPILKELWKGDVRTRWGVLVISDFNFRSKTLTETTSTAMGCREISDYV